MTDPAAARSFLLAEIEALEPFDFVAASPAAKPLHLVEVTRCEDHRLEVHVPGRPPILPELPIPIRSGVWAKTGAAAARRKAAAQMTGARCRRGTMRYFFSSSIGLLSRPTPSISISIVSPCRIQAGGLRA